MTMSGPGVPWSAHIRLCTPTPAIFICVGTSHYWGENAGVGAWRIKELKADLEQIKIDKILLVVISNNN